MGNSKRVFFNCTFCQHRDSNLQRKHFENVRISKEIEWILNNPIINDIAVLDPIFNSGSKYIRKTS